jgi:glucokinase
LACALPYIDPDDLRQIGAAEPKADATKAAVGPGTGLGVAGLARWNGRWVPVPSEGGHVELAATTPEEAALFEIIRKEHGRVSAEMVVSGRGFPGLHSARARLHGFPVPPGGLTPPELTDAALGGSDPQALATAQLFLKLLARFAGDVALVFGAVGGVYLHGGVTQKLSPLIDPAAFRAEFEAKAPHDRWLAGIASMYIADATPALLGCAALALDRFR